MQKKRAQSANPNSKNARRPKRKYTKSVDIVINDVISRAGKATTHFFMPISQAVKA